jgi:uroporphyrin-3 C-methyltransferase
MSDVPESPKPPPQTDTGEALARMAGYGEDNWRAKSRRGWGPLVIVLVVLLPLAAVGGIAWLHVEMRKELDVLRAANAALQQQSAGSTSQVAQLQESQQELGSSLEQSQQELQANLQRSLEQMLEQAVQPELSAANAAVAAQAQRIAALERQLQDLRQAATGATTSPLSDAEAMLRFAQQRLVLARDVAAAIDLYVAADELLAGVEDPRVFSLRDVLARELAQLRAVPVVDVSGLFAQLSAQARRVEDLAVAVETTATERGTTQTEAVVADSDWWGSVQQTLGEYFVVTRSTDAVLPQLNSEEQLLIRALIQLRIEQARFALLRSDQRLYQQALADALSSSRQWLSPDDSAVAEFLRALEALRNMPIVADIPTVDETLVALRAISGAPQIAPPLKPADPAPLPDAQRPAAGTQL